MKKLFLHSYFKWSSYLQNQNLLNLCIKRNYCLQRKMYKANIFVIQIFICNLLLIQIKRPYSFISFYYFFLFKYMFRINTCGNLITFLKYIFRINHMIHIKKHDSYHKNLFCIKQHAWCEKFFVRKILFHIKK